MARFKYPPCKINSETERPYTRHKWVIITREVDGRVTPVTRQGKNGLIYHVICERCKVRDPRQERF